VWRRFIGPELKEVGLGSAAVAGIRNLCCEIFDIRRAADFSSTVSLFRALWGFHRPPAESLAGNPNIRPHKRFASCETNFVHELRNC
jgi:hypothetical protein